LRNTEPNPSLWQIVYWAVHTKREWIIPTVKSAHSVRFGLIGIAGPAKLFISPLERSPGF
jgi:hypothetical protein